MTQLGQTLRKHPLVLAFAVAAVTMAALLGMQWTWLTRLESASAIAHRASLHNGLEAVGASAELFYRSTAERLLNVPASQFEGGDIAGIASYWKNKPHAGVRRLFVVDYTQVPTGNFYIYDPEKSALSSTPASDESLAIVLAALPWQRGSLGTGAAQPTGLQVNERNAAHRIVLSPIAGSAGTTVGIAGMILDQDFFLASLLPETVAKTLPDFFADAQRDELVLAVYDERQELVFGKPVVDDGQSAATLRFPFVFNDWSMRLTSSGATPEQWASTAFALNMSLGLLLAVVLLGAIGMALGAANRTMHLSEMKSDFVSNVSHELRTPLASIRVFAELLRHGKATEAAKVREYGEYIEAESRRLSRLIDNILDFSRIESQRKVYSFSPTDVAELVTTVTTSLGVRLERAGFKLEVALPEEKGPTLELDGDAIGQALHNLIDNATKYSEAPNTIHVTVRRQQDCVVIEVRDHGIGIAKPDQAKIFDRFHRVGTGLVHDVKGSGLGLAIVAHVMQAHRGTVEVDSEPGRGSTFSLRLPQHPDTICEGADRSLDGAG